MKKLSVINNAIIYNYLYSFITQYFITINYSPQILEKFPLLHEFFFSWLFEI